MVKENQKTRQNKSSNRDVHQEQSKQCNMKMSWQQGQPSENTWHCFSSRHNVFIFVPVLLNSNSLCRCSSTNFTWKVEIKRISKMQKIKEKEASKSSAVLTRPVKHMQPQSQLIWFSNWATEIALKANEANHKNQMMFRQSPKSRGIKNENKPNRTRNKCIRGYHPNDDGCFCLDIFMLAAG